MARTSIVIGSALFLGVIGAAFAVAAVPAHRNEQKSQLIVEKPVRVAAVEHRPVQHPIRATGQVHSKYELSLSFLVGGQVTWVGVDVGSSVRRGQILARIDETQIAADTERARAAASKARRDLERVTALHRSEALPQASLDDAETAATIASAQRRSAEFALRHGVLVAPDDGTIDARLVDPGEIVGPAQPVLHLSGRARGAVVRVALSDRDVIGLDVGRGATVSIDPLGDETFTAKVSQIATIASPGSGTFEVELRLDSPPAHLPSGMTAKVEIQRIVEAGSVVPVAALGPADGTAASIAVVQNGVVHRRPVRVLFLEGTEVALVDALPDVTTVATEGSTSLTEGLAVKEVRP